METKLVVCVFVCLIGLSVAVPWKDCGSKKGKVKNVNVVGCEKASVCPLYRGQNASFEVDFTSLEEVTKATAVVHGVIAGIPVPFPLPNPNACKDSNLQCPLIANMDYKYKATFPVKTEYPKVKVVVKYEIKDQNSDDAFCIEIPAQIEDPSKQDNTLYFRPRGHH